MKMGSGMGRRSLQFLGLIIALIIQLQLVAACGSGSGNQAAPPIDTQNATPAVPQEPGNTTTPPAEMPAVITPPSLAVWNQADIDRLKATKSCVDCNLNGADLASADLSGANLSSSYLIGANLSGADLSGASLTHARLHNANLANANLTRANLTFWADLSGANLTGANLTGADLSAASQYNSGANLTGANLSSTVLSATIWTDGRVCKDTSIGQCE
jgi:uncharacterized protein YjbI with pentapeptide repeats